MEIGGKNEEKITENLMKASYASKKQKGMHFFPNQWYKGL